MKVGITGAEGHIGTTLREGLGPEFEISSFTLGPQSFDSTVADLSNPAAVNEIFQGLDAVVHLAADPSPRGSWESMLKNNIAATYNVLEECRSSGVKKVVFATTNHTQHGDTMGGSPEILDMSRRVMLRLNDPLNPTSLYGVSKATGEQLGRYFATHHGVQFVGLRIGSTGRNDTPRGSEPRPSDDYNMAMFISKRDMIQAVSLALNIDRDFTLAYAISNNDARIFDMRETNDVLGFYPVDNSADY
ncbi:MAG: NAD(P)-dependent oxidoreductase [Chloroflexi bacterium]|nr:NAD(P)-dependent oxidoreductase [Chloroflexota bacterium]